MDEWVSPDGGPTGPNAVALRVEHGIPTAEDLAALIGVLFASGRARVGAGAGAAAGAAAGSRAGAGAAGGRATPSRWRASGRPAPTQRGWRWA